MNKTYKVICTRSDAPELPGYVAAEFATKAEAESYADLSNDCQSFGSHAIYTVV